MPLDEITDSVASNLPSLSSVGPAAAIATLAETIVAVVVGVATGRELFQDPDPNAQTALQNEYDMRTSTDIQIEVMSTCVPPEGSAGMGSRQVEDVVRILNRNGSNVVTRHREIVREVAFVSFADPIVEGVVSNWMTNMARMHNCIEELATEASFTHNPDPPRRCKVQGMVTRCLRYEDETDD